MTRTGATRREVVIVFLKAPVPGRVKTRLMPRLNAEEAAALYRAMAEDLLERLDRLRAVDLLLRVTPPSKMESMRRWLGKNRRLEPQRGSDLGARLAASFRAAFRSGYERVVIVGSDVPQVTSKTVRVALSLLRRHDVVIGPSPDGGYYLIGLCKPRPELFTHMPWSTSTVLPDTLRRISRLGLTVGRLPRLADLDLHSDARRLWRDLQEKRIRPSTMPRVSSALRGIFGARQGPASKLHKNRTRPRGKID